MQHHAIYSRVVLIALVTALAAGAARQVVAQTRAEDSSPAKHALLVGIDGYQHADLNESTPRKYAEADVRELENVLAGAGYAVVLLCGQEATLARIRQSLQTLCRQANGAAVVLVALAGHGIQPESSKEAYYCPFDADQHVLDRPQGKTAVWNHDTLLPLSEVLGQLRACGAQSKVLLVDACYNDPKTGRGRGFGTGFTLADVPENLALILSCSKGERAWEDDHWGHGAFFYHVLAGLRDRKAQVEGRVTAASLTAYVTAAVSRDVPVVIGGGATQRPHAIINGVDFRLQPDQLDRLVINSLGMKLVLIPPGEFWMGSTPGEIDRVVSVDSAFRKEWADDEHPQHRVRITRPFYLGAHEVTRGQFAQFVAATGYKTDAEKAWFWKGGWGWNESQGKFEGRDPKYNWKFTGFPYEDSHPVVNVSWNDAQAFCQWLSQKEGRQYRLPTEAEWEYACRAGTQTSYYYGDDPIGLGLALVGNVRDASAKAIWSNYQDFSHISASDGWVFTAPVGRYRPNAFGLYDMHGNVWEWCEDVYDARAYSGRGGVTDDPVVRSGGSLRLCRGGSWRDSASLARSADRGGFGPSYRSHALGFRLALSPSG